MGEDFEIKADIGLKQYLRRLITQYRINSRGRDIKTYY